MEVVLTHINPSMIGLCANLTSLNLSHCFELEPLSTMRTVVKCKNLTAISLVNCLQFSEQQLTELLCSCVKLEYVDCSGTQDMIFCNCLSIVCSLSNLEKINVEPKYMFLEKRDWERLVRTFTKIQFGHSIMRMFSHHGKYLRV